LLVFVSLDTKTTAKPRLAARIQARLLDGRAELIARDGSVIAREGDVLGDLAVATVRRATPSTFAPSLARATTQFRSRRLG